MANEAIIRVRLADPIDMTISNVTGVEKGTLLKLSDPLTCAPYSGAAGNAPVAGVLAREKIASDGRTRAAVFTRGIFDCTVNAEVAVGVGDLVTISGATNLIYPASAVQILSGAVLGKALESGAVNEVINVLVGVY